MEDLALALCAGALHGEVVAADDHVLRRRNDRAAVLRLQDVVRREHEEAGLGLRFDGQRHMHGHLVAVEVRVKRGADERMELDGAALDKDRLKGLDAEPVQRGRAVQHDGVVLDDVLEHAPNLGCATLDHALCALDVLRKPALDELFHHKGLEQLERHFLRQAALVHLKLRPHDDNGAAGIVHALAEQVLAEASLLAAEHVGQ